MAMVLPIASLSAKWNSDLGMISEEIGLVVETGVNDVISDQDEMGLGYLPLDSDQGALDSGQGMVPEGSEISNDTGVNDTISNDEGMGSTIWDGGQGGQGLVSEGYELDNEIGVDGTVNSDDGMGSTRQKDDLCMDVESPEIALEKAVDYIISNHKKFQGLVTPSSWKQENITPERLLGSIIMRFTEGEWTGKILFASVEPSLYDVEIDYVCYGGVNCDGRISTIEGGFHWEGQVDLEGNIVETTFKIN